MDTKISRGGSWYGTDESCQSAYRSGHEPSFHVSYYGFRVVKVKPPAKRVSRGGGWYCMAEDCRSASRDRDYPSNRNNDGGFRVVKEIPNG